MTLNRSLRPIAAVAAALLVAACSNAGSGDGAGGIEVTNAWARNSPVVATAGAVYLEIANDGDADDALVAASADATVAGSVELHETAPAMDAGMSSEATMGSEAPMMEMRPVEEIPVAAGESVALEPGGYHIMLLDLGEPLEVGDQFEVTLTFEQAGELDVTVEVRESAP